jgi:hypothetical protein
MKLFRYHPASNAYDSVTLRVADAEPVIGLHFVARRVGASWKSVSVEGFEDNPGVESDFPSLNDFNRIPIMSERAWEALRPLIADAAEPLPINYRGSKRRYLLINVFNQIDCLDPRRSKFSRAGRKIDQVYHYALKTDLICGAHLFKLPLESGADLLVDEAFRRAVEEHKLKGLKFKEIDFTPV